MKKAISIIILLGLCGCFSFAEQPGKILEKAYKINSDSLAIRFFTEWNNNSQPITADEYNQLSDTIKNIYELFNKTFEPYSLAKYNFYFLDSIYEADFDTTYLNVKYFILPKTIYWGITDSFRPNYYDTVYLNTFDDTSSTRYKRHMSLYRQGKFYYYDFSDVHFIKRDSIIKFRPYLPNYRMKLLTLSDDYENTINNFLSTEKVSVRSFHDLPNNILTKYNFLSKYIRIFYGHWGGYWTMETFPAIGYIVFNKNIDMAVVFYRGYWNCGGYALYKMKEGKWIQEEVRSIWVE